MKKVTTIAYKSKQKYRPNKTHFAEARTDNKDIKTHSTYGHKATQQKN